MFLLFLSVVSEAVFARSYLLSLNAFIYFITFFFKTLWDENLCGGWSQSFLLLLFSYDVVVEWS